MPATHTSGEQAPPHSWCRVEGSEHVRGAGGGSQGPTTPLQSHVALRKSLHLVMPQLPHHKKRIIHSFIHSFHSCLWKHLLCARLHDRLRI